MMNVESELYPALRFPEYTDEWVNVTLNEIASFSKGKGIAKSDIDPDGHTFCVRYGELYTSYGTIIDEPISKTSVSPVNLVLSDGGEVIVPASGESAEDIATASVVLRKGIALGGDLNIIKSPLNGAFLAFYLSGKKRVALAGMAQGNSVVHLYASQLGALRIGVPNQNEQDKIARFLVACEAKIALLEEKRRGLLKYRTGCMQLLFLKKIRFTDENGKSFPNWTVRSLSEIAERVKERNTSGAVKDVLTNSAIHGIVSQRDFFDNDVANAENLDRYTVVDIGDFVYNPRISESAPVGPIKRNDIGIGVMSPLYDVFRFRDKETDFWKHYFESPFWHRYMKKVANYGARHDRMAISSFDFFNMPIPYPHQAEKKRISDFLNSVDAMIFQTAGEIALANSFQKGLLSKLFI